MYFTDIFTTVNNSRHTHNYSTRNRDNISFERVQHEYAKKHELDIAFQIHFIIVPISSNINYIYIALRTNLLKRHHIETYKMTCEKYKCYIIMQHK